LRCRFLFVGGAVALFVAALLVFGRLGAEFVPQLDEGSFATHMIRTTSIGLDASIAMQERAEQVLKEKFPDVAYTFSRIGTAEVATDPMGVNVADTYIFYKPLDEWPKIDGKALTKDELANQMSAELEIRVPGQAYLSLSRSRCDSTKSGRNTRRHRGESLRRRLRRDREDRRRRREILESVPGAADVEFDALGKGRCSRSPRIAKRWQA
jgi:cobalt-zinc-cadmium resistance protein CzcA